MLMTIEEKFSILNKALNQKGILRKGTDAVYFCPNCKHHKRKLEINLQTGKYNCWVCDLSGLNFSTLIKKLHLNIDKRIFSKSTTSFSSKKENIIHSLPDGFKSLSKIEKSIERNRFIFYLKKRGITDLDIIRYNIGYCSTGTFSERIIIPSYDENFNLNFYVGRSIFEDSKLKYKNCLFTKNIIGFESFVDFKQPVTLVEGCFDAISVRYNAVPLFGKTMSENLKIKILENNPPYVNILLDNDAVKDSLEIAQFLLSNNIKTKIVLLNGKDPSVVGFCGVYDTISQTPFLTQDVLLKMNFLL